MDVVENEKYEYVIKEKSGKWIKSGERYTMTYKVTGNYIELQPSTSPISYKLVKD